MNPVLPGSPSIGTSIVDHVGRRKLLLSGISCAAAGMLIVGALLSPAGEESKARANSGIAFICGSAASRPDSKLIHPVLFMVCFSFGFTPLQSVLLTRRQYRNSRIGVSIRQRC